MTMTPDELWNEIQYCFLNDGEASLPTLELQNLSAKEINSVYLQMRIQSQVVTPAPFFWHDVEKRNIPLDDVANAAELVVSGQAAPFSFTVEAIQIDDVILPMLTIEIFQDTVAISFSTRDHWNALRACAFFSWLSFLLDGTQAGQLVVSAVNGPPDHKRFTQAWNRFINDSGRAEQ
ncbi:hypothetical protein [Gimesia chilikensis]|nr:hypothetical protein [Gimesia chilikensis]